MALVEPPMARGAAFSAQRSWVRFPSPVCAWLLQWQDSCLPSRKSWFDSGAAHLSGEEFPEEMQVLIVDDLYRHYDLGFDDSENLVHVFCEHCSDVVCVLDYDTIKREDEMTLYERIVESHRPVE